MAQIELAALVLIVCLGHLLGALMAIGATRLLGYDQSDLIHTLSSNTSSAALDTVRLLLAINHVFTFILPTLALGWLLYRGSGIARALATDSLTTATTPRLDWAYRLRLHRRPDGLNVAISCGWIVLALFAAGILLKLNQLLPLPDGLAAAEERIGGTITALVATDRPIGLLLNLVVIAILPALGEELLFRGWIQQSLHRWIGHGHAAVWVSAAVFSAIHFQFQGFLPRLMLGAVLGYMLLYTRNLWVPIIAHFVNNGLQLVVQYIYSGDEAVAAAEVAPFSFALAVQVLTMIGLVVLAGYGLYRYNVDYTPLRE